MNDSLRLTANGYWQDEYTYSNGEVQTSPWHSNQIQYTGLSLLGGLVGDTNTEDSTFLPIKYMAFGSGQVGWHAPDAPTMPRESTTLTAEYFRKEIFVANRTYVDPATDSEVAFPTSIVTFKVDLLEHEGAGLLREFGLFGGSATGDSDTGLMFNWVTHPTIVKDASFRIRRTVRIEFSIA